MDIAVAHRDPCAAPVIESYEPVTLGETKQSDDESFVDFTLSLKAELFSNWICRKLRGRDHLYLTFTGRVCAMGCWTPVRQNRASKARRYLYLPQEVLCGLCD